MMHIAPVILGFVALLAIGGAQDLHGFDDLRHSLAIVKGAAESVNPPAVSFHRRGRLTELPPVRKAGGGFKFSKNKQSFPDVIGARALLHSGHGRATGFHRLCWVPSQISLAVPCVSNVCCGPRGPHRAGPAGGRQLGSRHRWVRKGSRGFPRRLALRTHRCTEAARVPLPSATAAGRSGARPTDPRSGHVRMVPMPPPPIAHCAAALGRGADWLANQHRSLSCQSIDP